MFELLPATSLNVLIALWTIILLASVLRAFTGFGFALCAVPGFSLFLPATDSAVLSVMLTLGISILTIRNYVREYPPKSMSLILLMALLGTVAGNQVLLQIDQNLFRILVGTIVIFAGLFLSLYRPKTQIRSRFLEANGGLFAGLMNGAFAIPGPPIIIYAMFAEPEPNRSRAMLMQFFAVAALLGFLSFSFSGMVHRELVSVFFLCMPVMIMGNYIGSAFFEKHGDRSYRVVAISSSLFIGTVTIASVLILDIQ